MRAYLEGCIAEAKACTSPAEIRIHVIAILRLILQHCCYGMVQWLSAMRPPPSGLPPASLVDSLKEPSDGTLVEAVEDLLYWCERAGWSGIATIPSQEIPPASPASILCGDRPSDLDSLLRSLVALRNDGAEGHGLPGGYNPQAEIAAIEVIIQLLSPVLPQLSSLQQTFFCGPPGGQIRMELMRDRMGVPPLIRKIREISGQRVRVEAQYRKGQTQRETASYEAPNPFLNLAGPQVPSFSLLSGEKDEWTPWYFLPDRKTDAFTGRKDELGRLAEWLDDEDSRTCLVFGDGGLGKTTLTVEFVHRWLEGSIKAAWRPDYITFYTAKRWRWGLDGLEVERPGAPHMLDLVAQLHSLFFDRYPDARWYRMGLAEAAQRLAGRIQEVHKTGRDQHLIIIDNAETLIEREIDRDRLARELKEIARRLGRVIITSRRREYIEAAPIEVKPLATREGVKLLQKRAESLRLQPVLKAPDDVLLDCVREFGGKPLLLDALLHSLGDPATPTLKLAKDRVNRMLSKDLGTFLFDDAWQRLTVEMRHLLLILVRINDVHDTATLRICCDAVGLPVGSAESALEESAGIASISRVSGDLQIEFSPSFIRFAETRTVTLDDGTVAPTEECVTSVKLQYANYLRAVRRFVGDRFPQAYGLPAAKAARIAALEGRIEDARRFFEQAVLADGENGWLFDRYALFLQRRAREPQSALGAATRATQLLPAESEPWFTRGIIEARLGLRHDFEQSFRKAEELGCSRLRCALQRAWGYTATKPPQLALAAKELDVARLLIQRDQYYDINITEISRIEERIAYLKRDK